MAAKATKMRKIQHRRRYLTTAARYTDCHMCKHAMRMMHVARARVVQIDLFARRVVLSFAQRTSHASQYKLTVEICSTYLLEVQ